MHRTCSQTAVKIELVVEHVQGVDVWKGLEYVKQILLHGFLHVQASYIVRKGAHSQGFYPRTERLKERA